MLGLYEREYVTDIVKIFSLGAISFLVAFLLTPILTHFLYKYRFGKHIREDGSTPVFSKMHAEKSGTPTMGGILIWFTTFFLAVMFAFLAWVSGAELFDWLSFLTRSETWLPLGMLMLAAFVGLMDDVLNVFRIGSTAGGFRVRDRWILYTLVAAVGAWWFYYKLGWDILHIPGVGDFSMGIWYIPFFIFVIIATAHSANIIDGLDGLAGGTLLASFGAYAALAFAVGFVDLAAFLAVIVGALLAFLWFNIPPARFFMGDTGSMALGTTLGIVAMLTNSALILPIIAFPLVATSLSVIIQVTSKKFFGRKVFHSAPVHHHFQAIGWPESKIVMRYWVVAIIFAVVGLIIGLIGRG
jgi:phospho-N-acetylmuramoyl-pentapeptide-transferase